jgi:ATP-dependent Clp protease protease subunit
MWKYDHLSELQAKLLEQGVVDLQGDVDSRMAFYVREALLRLSVKGNPEIKVLITSPGGDVGVGLDICDAFRLYPGKKTAIVTGFAQSMAAVILQVCEERHAARHAHILIHHVSKKSISLDDLQDSRRGKKLMEDLQKSQNRLYEILATRTKQSISDIRKVCKRDENMTSEEALKFGLIDKII